MTVDLPSITLKLDSMSDAPQQPSVIPPAPAGMPDSERDPEAFMAWALSPEGQAHFHRMGMALMEARVNAQNAGSGIAPTVVSLQPHSTTTSQ